MDRPRIVPFWIPLLFGLMSGTQALTSPTLAGVRHIDIVRLLITGFLFGATIPLFVMFLRQRRGRDGAR